MPYLVTLSPEIYYPWCAISENGLYIGRNPEGCQIVLAFDYVSKVHAQIRFSDQCYTIEDLNSQNGVYINSQRIREHVLSQEDIISFGNPHAIHFQYNASEFQPSQQIFKINRNSFKIGRGINNDLVINDPTISRRHIEINKKNGCFEIRDLNSQNGTWHRGQPISPKKKILPGDHIIAGNVKILFHSDHLTYYKKNFDHLEVLNLGLTKKHKLILHDVSFVVKPGDFVGIIGPSGSGKTTLIKALSAYYHPTSGDIRIYNKSIFQNVPAYRAIVGYVPQDDHVFSDLTIESCLHYAARLRLGRKGLKNEINSNVENILSIFGLADKAVRKRMISLLSGGQRKRVNVAVEMLTKPQILFLDEPSAGLDPCNEGRLMKHLRTMTNNGHTVIITTHILYKLSYFDKVAVIANGQLVYYGAPDEIVHFFFTDPAAANQKTEIDIFDLLEPEEIVESAKKNQNVQRYREKFIHSSYYNEIVSDISTPSDSTADSKAFPLLEWIKEIKPPSLFELVTLTKRHLQIKWCNTNTLMLMLGQAFILVGIILLSQQLPKEQLPGKFYVPISLPLLLVLAAIWCGTINSCREISGENHIFIHAKLANLGIFNYIASKLPFLLSISFLQSLILVFPVSFFFDLQIDFFRILFSVFGASGTGVFLGLFISSCDAKGDKSVLAVPMLMLPQIIFSGALAPNFLSEMSIASKAISNWMISRWAFENLWVEYNNPQIIDWGYDLINELGFQKNIFAHNLSVLTLYSVLLFVLTWIVLLRRKPG